MSERLHYEVVVVGGGPAGMTTALYTTRLGHRTAVFEREGGRHARVSEVHNLYGVSEAVSGEELARHAVDQLQEYGGDYHVDPVQSVERRDGGDEDGVPSDEPRFVVESTHATVGADAVAFATGFSDREPSIPELQRFAGRGLHYCLHCDAYTLGDSQTFVLGHDDHAAEVAMLLLNFTDEVDLLLNGHEPEWDGETGRQLEAHPVEVVDRAVDGAFARDEDAEEPWLGGLRFVDDTERAYRGGFAVYGTEYNSALPAELGCELTDDGAVAVDEVGATTVDGAYAVGDVTHGQNQTTIALSDGARAGIAMHKELRTFPKSLEELAGGADGRGNEETEDGSDTSTDEAGSTGTDVVDESEVPAAPPDLRARMRALRTRHARAGLRDPPPRQ